MIHPDNIPDTNISLPTKNQTKMTGRESKISKYYQVSREKLRKSTVKIPKNSKGQTKKASEGCEISENYQNLPEKPEASNIEMLNSINCEVQKLNEVDFSLILASCPATLETTRCESVEAQ